jgi:hypothetical protein
MAGGGQSLLVDGVRCAVVGAGIDFLRRPPSTGERWRVRVEAEVLEDAPCDHRVGDEGDDLEPTRALRTGQDVHREHLGQQLGPWS